MRVKSIFIVEATSDRFWAIKNVREIYVLIFISTRRILFISIKSFKVNSLSTCVHFNKVSQIKNRLWHQIASDSFPTLDYKTIHHRCTILDPNRHDHLRSHYIEITKKILNMSRMWPYDDSNIPPLCFGRIAIICDVVVCKVSDCYSITFAVLSKLNARRFLAFVI